MNKINNNNSLYFNGKVNIKRASLLDGRKICNFNVDHHIFSNLDVVTQRSKNSRKKFVISVKKKNITMARESLLISKKRKEMEGILIQTFARYRNQSLAEILRLASIITMFENNIQNFRIFALNTAKGFHTKYKFKPEGEEMFRGINMILSKEDIIKNKQFYNELFKKHGIEYKI